MLAQSSDGVEISGFGVHPKRPVDTPDLGRYQKKQKDIKVAPLVRACFQVGGPAMALGEPNTLPAPAGRRSRLLAAMGPLVRLAELPRARINSARVRWPCLQGVSFLWYLLLRCPEPGTIRLRRGGPVFRLFVSLV